MAPPADRQLITLSWCVDRYPNEPSQNEVNNQIRAALSEWEKYIEVRFEPAACNGNRTLTFSWEYGDHGDGYPFLPAIRAHAFFPPPAVPEPRAGDIHLNADYDWAVPLAIFATVLHEVGHALGLRDSTIGVMNWLYFAPLWLQISDIVAVRKLYPFRCFEIECAMRNTH